jgi:molecular chaperone GrpE
MSEKIKNNVKEDKKAVKKAAKGKMAKLQEEVAALKEKLQEAEDKNLRTLAEYDNYRKRSFRELTSARTAVKVDTLAPILNIFDHFNMAVTAAETSDDMNVIKEGMKMIASEFSKALEEYGIEEVNAIGKKFDPTQHEAVAKEASEEEEDTIIKQWRCGYKMGSHLIRPASVVVSSGPEEAEENE